jgi:hypothetical protein
MPEPKVSQTFKFRNKKTGEEMEIPASSRVEAMEMLKAQTAPKPRLSKSVPQVYETLNQMSPGMGDVYRYLIGDDPVAQVKENFGTREGLSKNVLRPGLETGFGIGGNLLGMPGGKTGMSIGGGAGYAMGAEVADAIDAVLGVGVEPKPFNEEAREAAERFAFGTAIESIVPALGEIKKLVGKVSNVFPKNQVADLLARIERSTSPMFSQNIRGSGSISEGIDAMKGAPDDVVVTLSQGSKNPTLAQEGRILAKSAAQAPGSEASVADQLAYTRGQNIKAADSRLTQGEPGEWVDSILSKKEAVEAAEAQAAKPVEEAAERMGTAEAATTGDAIHNAATAAEKAARKEYGTLLDESLEGVEVEVSGLVETAEKIKQGPRGSAGIDNPDINAFIKDATEDPNFSGVDLQRTRSEVLDAIRSTDDLKTKKALGEFALEIENVLNTASGDAFAVANKAWKENVADVFVNPEGARALSRTAKQKPITGDAFFKSGEKGVQLAKDLKRMVGEEKATELMRTVVGEKLVGKYPNLEAKNVQKWIRQNEYALKEYGLLDEMNAVAESATSAQAAKDALENFTKSPLAVKGLGADDPVVAVREIFTKGKGPMNQRQAVRDALETIGDNPEKVAALKNDFSTMLREEASTTAKTATGQKAEAVQEISYKKLRDSLKKYGPAIDELYTQEERAAMEGAADILETIAYGSKEAGSDTAIKLAAFEMAQGLGNLLVQMPGPLGAFILRPSGMMKYGFKTKADQYMFKVMTDPDFAKKMLELGMERSDKVIASRLARGVKTGTGSKIRLDDPAKSVDGFLARARKRLELNPELKKTLMQQMVSLGILEMKTSGD